jgi:hypothetical protein
METLLDVVKVVVKTEYILELEFENGERRLFDMSSLMDKKPFNRLKASNTFFAAHVDYGTVVWPGEIDIAPETLYELSVPVVEHEGETIALEFVVCLYKENTDDLSGDDLQLGRLYEVVEKDAGHGMLRIIDESGEDYLYPQTWFASVALSSTACEQLAKALPRG